MRYKACTLSRPGAFAPSLYLRAAEVQVPGQSKRTPTLQVPPSAPSDKSLTVRCPVVSAVSLSWMVRWMCAQRQHDTLQQLVDSINQTACPGLISLAP